MVAGKNRSEGGTVTHHCDAYAPIRTLLPNEHPRTSWREPSGLIGPLGRPKRMWDGIHQGQG
jgi:hypothetical protein